MIKLNKKLLQEIVEHSNHKNISSVEKSIYIGEIEVYKNKDKYEEVGYDLADKNLYIILSNANVIHFVGG